ncbi:MAG: co-chaperone GroES [Candidatus Buchananbacteria bacterium]|jgi:chaperonin GroES
MTIKPIGDRLLIAPVKEEEITKSGIILPDTAQEKKAEGIIVAIGSGEKVVKLGLFAGQKVIYGKYAGDEVKSDGKEYKILGHDDVLAVIE